MLILALSLIRHNSLLHRCLTNALIEIGSGSLYVVPLTLVLIRCYDTLTN
jgi:hypothetical protein